MFLHMDAQRESLMSQQLAQRGTNNIMSGGTQLFQGIKGSSSMRLKPKSRLNWKLLKIRCSVAQSQAMADQLGETLNFSAPSMEINSVRESTTHSALTPWVAWTTLA